MEKWSEKKGVERNWINAHNIARARKCATFLHNPQEFLLLTLTVIVVNSLRASAGGALAGGDVLMGMRGEARSEAWRRKVNIWNAVIFR